MDLYVLDLMNTKSLLLININLNFQNNFIVSEAK